MLKYLKTEPSDKPVHQECEHAFSNGLISKQLPSLSDFSIDVNTSPSHIHVTSMGDTRSLAALILISATSIDFNDQPITYPMIIAFPGFLQVFEFSTEADQIMLGRAMLLSFEGSFSKRDDLLGTLRLPDYTQTALEGLAAMGESIREGWMQT